MAKGKYEEWLKPEGLLLIEGWARDGLTDEQIAHNMGIGTSTLYKWKNEHKEIVESLKNGKEVIDRHVENALLKRALGYEYQETTQEVMENGTLSVTKIVTKQVSPDTTAQIFWLKNRKPSEWRDKQIMEHEGQQTFSIKLPGDLSGD
jgi:transposase-like protein